MYSRTQNKDYGRSKGLTQIARRQGKVTSHDMVEQLGHDKVDYWSGKVQGTSMCVVIIADSLS